MAAWRFFPTEASQWQSNPTDFRAKVMRFAMFKERW